MSDLFTVYSMYRLFLFACVVLLLVLFYNFGLFSGVSP